MKKLAGLAVALVTSGLLIQPMAFAKVDFTKLDAAVDRFNASLPDGGEQNLADASAVASAEQNLAKSDKRIKFACDPNLNNKKMQRCLVDLYKKASQQAGINGVGAKLRTCAAVVGLVIGGCSLSTKSITPEAISPPAVILPGAAGTGN